MIKYFQTLLSVFVLCTLCCKSGYAGVDQIQVQAVDELTAEFVKSGGDSAKPTAEVIKKRFNNADDKNFNSYSDILFQGSNGFGYNGKNADREQKTVETAAWNKALNTSKLATDDARISSFDEKAQNKCKKYGIVSACSKTGETR